MNTGVLIISVCAGVLGLLCITHYWMYRKGRTTGKKEGMEIEYAECNKRLTEMHNIFASGKLPDGMSESDQRWGVSTDKPTGGVESTNTDVH